MFKKILKTTPQIIKNSSFKTQKLSVLNNNKYNYSIKKSAAVLLSGCGYLDGSEVTEAVSAIIQLQKQNYTVDCFAPDFQQEQTFDHDKGTLEKNETRKIDSESARIARKLQPLKKLKASSYSLLVVPGGFGVARNLSTWAEDGIEFKVKDDVKEVLLDFKDSKKPIAFLCIAPVLAANVFGKKNGGKGCKITLGTDPEISAKVEQLGVTVEKKNVNEVCIDFENNIVSTPAYMESKADPLTVFEAVGKCISSVSQLSGGFASVGLSKEVLKAVDGLSGGKPEKQKWWIDNLLKGEEQSKETNYKSTIKDPKNWVQSEY